MIEENNQRLVSEILTETINVGKYMTYLARPLDSQHKNLPAVIIFHEIYGLTDHIKNVAERFAHQGYIGLAVDLYSAGNNRPLCVLRTMMDVAFNVTKSSHLEKLDDIIKFLQNRDEVDQQQLGVIGFCMGGGYALALAIHNQAIKACSTFYGVNPVPLSSVARVCPVVGSYADRDPFLPGFMPIKLHPRLAQKLDHALTQYQRPHEIKIYSNTKHSFFDETNKRAYNPNAAKDSWERTLKFFEEHLKLN